MVALVLVYGAFLIAPGQFNRLAAILSYLSYLLSLNEWKSHPIVVFDSVFTSIFPAPQHIDDVFKVKVEI